MRAIAWSLVGAVLVATIACKSNTADPPPAPPPPPQPAALRVDAAVAPAPELFLTFDSVPGDLTLAGDVIYYGDGSSLRAVSTTTREVRRLAELSGGVRTLGVRRDTLYFLATPSLGGGDPKGYLESIPITGGKPSKLATFAAGVPSTAIVDGGIAMAFCCGAGSKVQMIGFDGKVQPLYEWAPAGNLSITADGAEFYVGSERDPQILHAAGGKVDVAASDERGVESLLADEYHVLWTNPGSDELHQVLKPTLRVEGRVHADRPEVFAHAYDPRVLARDDQALYYVGGEGAARTLRRRASGVTRELMPALGLVQVVVDSHYVYAEVEATRDEKGKIVRVAL